MWFILLIKLCLCIICNIPGIFAESNTVYRYIWQYTLQIRGCRRYTQWCTQFMSHEQPPASFLNDESIYYVYTVYTVSDKRKLHIKRWEVFQVIDHILMFINVGCKLKGGGWVGTKLDPRILRWNISCNLDDFCKKKCRYFIEELENKLNEYFCLFLFPLNHLQIWGTELNQQKNLNIIFESLQQQQQKLAATLPLPPSLFRRLSNFSINIVADSIF